MIDKQKFSSKNEIDMYQRYGFTILQIFSEKEFYLLKYFAIDWVYRLLASWVKGKEDSFPLEKYHLWSKTLNVDHAGTFGAKNRYLYPGKELEKILLNDRVKRFLTAIGMERYKIWDDGWG